MIDILIKHMEIINHSLPTLPYPLLLNEYLQEKNTYITLYSVALNFDTCSYDFSDKRRIILQILKSLTIFNQKVEFYAFRFRYD